MFKQKEILARLDRIEAMLNEQREFLQKNFSHLHSQHDWKRDEIIAQILDNKPDVNTDDILPILLNDCLINIPTYLLKFIIHCRQSVQSPFPVFDIESPHFNWIRERIRPDEIVFDVGANIGLFTVAMSPWVNRGGMVYAFEPGRKIYRDLQAVVAANRCKNVVLNNVAVGESKGTVRFGELESNDASREASRVIEGENSETQGYEVEVIDLDSFCEQHQLKPTLFKIDVEGFEIHVLKGMKKILETVGPKLVIEVHHDLLNVQGVAELKQILDDNSYSITELPKTWACTKKSS
jgi:FkbM family methyltransferase